MLRPTLFLSVILLSTVSGSAQDVLQEFRWNRALTIQHEDSRIDSLLAKQVRINKARPEMKGYRVQLFSGSGNEARQQANILRSEFLQLYPDLPAHLVFQQPNFKVRIGDLRTEIEAVRLKKEIEFDFPSGFVVRDMIELPKIPERKEDPLKDQ